MSTAPTLAQVMTGMSQSMSRTLPHSVELAATFMPDRVFGNAEQLFAQFSADR